MAPNTSARQTSRTPAATGERGQDKPGARGTRAAGKRQNARKGLAPRKPLTLRRRRDDPDAELSTLQEIFSEVGIRLVRRLAQNASPDQLKRALTQPTEVGTVASVLSDVGNAGIDLSTLDPLAEAVARGAIRKRTLLEQAGGAFTTQEVADLLDVSRQAIKKRRDSNGLLAVPGPTGDFVYPACQFDPVLPPAPELKRVLDAIPETDPWMRLEAMISPSPAAGNQTLLDLLRRGEGERATEIAAEIG